MKSAPRTAWLFTHPCPEEIFSSFRCIDPRQDLLIAVDGGLAGLRGFPPDLIIGDFDSADPALLQAYPDVPKLAHPARKNETDTELAILWCLEREARQIVILNELGGRFDHALALVQNLDFLLGKGCRGSIESSLQRVFFLEAQNQIEGCEGCLLSLLAWSAEARFGGSSGLEYPLDGIALSPLRPRGMSNRVTSDLATISLVSGSVLAILTKNI